jgi:hypothetical protein
MSSQLLLAAAEGVHLGTGLEAGGTSPEVDLVNLKRLKMISVFP